MIAARRYFLQLCLIMALVSAVFTATAGKQDELRNVTLQLKWKHQFQFAGYYAAAEKGYYREAGLQVDIKEADGINSPNETVFNGNAEFGISTSEVLLLRSKNRKAVVLASVFQHSPLVLLILEKSGIKHTRDLIGKKIALEENSGEIVAYLNNEGVTLDKCIPVKQTFDLQSLIDGEVDAVTAYSSDETFELEERGIAYSVLSPLMAGLDFYGDVLYTSEDLLKRDPELVKKFRDASLQGWHYALEHEDEIIDLIYNKYSQRHSKKQLAHEAEHMKYLVMKDVVEVGYSNPERWQNILNVFQSFGLIDKSQSSQGLLYADLQKYSPDINWRIVRFLLLVILVIAAVSYFFYYTTKKLRKEIKNREKIQEELIKSEGLYRSVLNASPDTIVITDRKGIVEFVSPMVNKMFGFSEKDVINRPLFDFLIEEDRSRAIADITQMFNGNFTGAKEYSGVRTDGSTFPFEAKGEFIRDAGGAPTGIVFVARNISERKMAEARLRKNEESIRTIVESINDVIYEINSDGIITYVSPSVERILGYTPAEISGKRFFDFLDENGSKDKAGSDYGQGEMADSPSEHRYISKDGGIRWLRSSITPIIENGKIIGGTGTITDITERKNVEVKVIKANRLYAFISLINQAMVRIRKKDALLSEVCRIAVETGGFRMAWIGFVEEASRLVKPHVFAGNEAGYLSVISRIGTTGLPEGNVPAGTSIRTGKYYLCNDIETDPAMTPWKQEALARGYRSSVSFPIGQGGKVIGAMTLYSAVAYFFDTEEIELLGEVTSNISFALEAMAKDKEVKDLYANLEIKISERTVQLAEVNMALVNEIEEKNRVELALSKSEQNYKTFIDNVKEVIFSTDAAGLWLFLNKSWAEITGFSVEESLGMNFLNYVYPEDRERNMELFLPLINREKEYCRHEIRYITKDGGYRWIEVYARLGLNDQDEITGTYGTLRDITEKKLSENFENELLQLTPSLTGLSGHEIDNALNLALSRIGKFLRADRAYIFEFDEAKQFMSNTFEWCNEGIKPEIENLKDIPCDATPKWMESLEKNENILIPSVKDLPESWQAERDILEPQSIQSLIVIPMLSENELIGFVGLDSVRNKKEYSSVEINILTVWSRMLASLIHNQRTDRILEQTRQNYETFFNTIDDFLWVLDEKGNIVHINSTVKNRLEYSEDELYNTSVLLVHPPERREEAGRIVGEMLVGVTEFCPVPVVTKSGAHIPVETRVKPGFWDRKPVIFGVSKDVSKIKLSEEKFSKAFQSSAALMAISGFESGIYIDVNDTFLETLGYHKNEVIGTSSAQLNVLDSPGIREEVLEKIKQKIPVRDIELEVRRKDGSCIIGLFSAEVIYVGDDMCLLTLLVDISERKKAEEDLKRARIEAEKANFAKSEFLSRMSHELRTPMNSILGFAQLLDMGDLNHGQKKGVSHILKSGKHLLDLINEVLDISRIEAGRLSLSLEPVQIKTVIIEMMDIVRQFANERGINLDFEESKDNLLSINCDKQRLKQILLNLINNAIKYNIKGGSVHLESRLMDAGTDGTRYVRIIVKDTGIGINPEDIPKLFNPFERIGAEKTEMEGTGLGLSVVKKLTDAMGGNIGIESKVGEGSTFWIEFPLSDVQAEPKEMLEMLDGLEKGLSVKSGTILYIEDNVSNIELVNEILSTQRSNLSLITIANGMKALPMALEYKPDLILLDLNLPDMHGSEVLLLLKADETTRSIPVVVISADAMPKQVEKLKSAGAINYLTKPLDLTILLKIIDEIIAG